MFLVGILIHICLLLSVFDIYFKSPIVKNVMPYKPLHEALADRLVLFVIDGLRAENFVNYSAMPYLRNIANSQGRWGISHTHVPTESRPGHVAMISGFYEDPSAVTKGWKDNPVDFDSVFNQSTYTWCWGDHVIMNIFTKDNSNGHIFTSTFDPYKGTFSTSKNTTLLDAWVVDNVTTFFQNASRNASVGEKLAKDKIIFFLHLWGTDVSGHKNNPNSQIFLSHLKFVDESIEKLEKVFRDFYKDDGKTTFLLTSDHGMTDWGSHGSGDDHETETPYVIWGAGVLTGDGNWTDPSTKGMSLDRRLDIEQADLAPLMATVLSVPVPVNNVGKLASDVLNLTIANKAKALYSNARQLASQYDKKRSEVEENVMKLLYYPYQPLTKQIYKEKISKAEKLLREKEYNNVILLSQEIMTSSISGLNYYHSYYQTTLLILVTLSLIGWILCLFRVLAQQDIKKDENWSFYTYKYNFSKFYNFDYKRHLSLNLIFSALLLASFYFVFVQKLPAVYYGHFIMPVLLWWYALSSFKAWRTTFQSLKDRGFPKLLTEICCYGVGSIALGLSFSYRWMLSLPLLGMAVWPFLSGKQRHLSRLNLITWTSSCAVLSFFTFMPVVGKKAHLELVIVAGLLRILAAPVYIWKVVLPLCRFKLESKQELIVTLTQIILRLVTLENVYVQSKRFERSTAVSSFDQAIAWIIAVASVILPLLHSKRVVCRLFAINASILNLYLLMAVAHEGLFMVALMYNTGVWLYIEFTFVQPHATAKQVIELTFGANDIVKSLKNSHMRGIEGEDFRRAFFFMTYIITAFFGTGNLASINSFEVRWVTCFLTSYKPIIITILILLKTLAPFLVVTCNFKSVQLLAKAPVGYLNVIVLIFSNLMGILLLYCVKNTGSWREIGTSLTQYVLVQMITIFVVFLTQIARMLTECQLPLSQFL